MQTCTRNGGKGSGLISGGGYDLADKLSPIIKSYGVFTANFVAHSKGGLWTRRFLSRLEDSPNPVYSNLSVAKIITLDTPHSGSVLANYLNALNSESEAQMKNENEHNYINEQHFLNLFSGTLPWDYEAIRDEMWMPYWPSYLSYNAGNPCKNPHSPRYRTLRWWGGARDLDSESVETFKDTNLPLLASFVNPDGSQIKWEVFFSDANLNEDSPPYISQNEHTPLSASMLGKLSVLFDYLPGVIYEAFFTKCLRSVAER